MNIVLSGVETNNKGAELMLYAILQEVERRHPDATVYISQDRVVQGRDYVKTSLDLRFFPLEKLEKILNKTHINGIIKRIGLPQMISMNNVKADYFFDGSGFLFSDHCNLWGTEPNWWETVLKHQSRNGAKIVFLPQAFGPMEIENTREAMSVLSKYSTLIMPREQVSYNYLKDSGIVDMSKVRKCMDFTSLVVGVFPQKYNHLKDGVCIIPNMEMIRQNKISYNDYVDLLSRIAIEGGKSNRPVFLLNHEGQRDESFCLKCKESMGDSIEVVTGLNALEVKGLISSSYIVITSRFHGLASSLNSGVPSLATSWSHKYEELFNDYNQKGYVLPLDNIDAAVDRVRTILDPEENQRIRKHLNCEAQKIVNKTKEMWDTIWAL